MSEQSDTGRRSFGLTTSSYHGKLTTILLIKLISELTFGFVCGRSINMIIYWVFDSTKAEATIKDCPAVLFVSLAEARVLVELRENLVQRRYRMIAL